MKKIQFRILTNPVAHAFILHAVDVCIVDTVSQKKYLIFRHILGKGKPIYNFYHDIPEKSCYA